MRERERESERLGYGYWAEGAPHCSSRRSRRPDSRLPSPQTSPLTPSGISHIDRSLKFRTRTARQAETAMRGGIEDHLLTLIENAAANVDKTLEKQME